MTEQKPEMVVYYLVKNVKFKILQIMPGLMGAVTALSLLVAGVSANRGLNKFPLQAKDVEQRDYRYKFEEYPDRMCNESL